MGCGLGNVVKTVATGGLGGSGGQNVLNALDGSNAADAALEGSQTAAAGQQKALDYLQKQNQTPEELKQAALKQLGGIYGLPGFDSVDMTGQVMNSPIYKAMAGQIDQSLSDNQDQAGASASQRGLLGSGVLGDALAKYRARAGVDKSNAASQVYQQQIGGLTGLGSQQTYAPDIANLFAAKGLTLGQGQTAAGQAQQQGINNLLQAGGSVAAAFSDIRLKSNVRYVGKLAGHEWYSWTWNDVAAKLGLSGTGEGVMAHLVEKYAPHAIGENSGFMTVDYNAL